MSRSLRALNVWAVPCLLLAGSPAPAAAAECPDGTVALYADESSRNRADCVKPECPEGMALIFTNNPYRPLECVGHQQDCPSLSKFTAGQECVSKPRCPRGSRPFLKYPEQLPLECVRGSAKPEPELPSGTGAPARPEAQSSADLKKKVAVGPPAASVRRTKEEPPSLQRLTARAFGRYTIPGQISFEFPRDWPLRDAWHENPAAIYVVYETGRGGKQVALGVTLNEPGQPGYQDLDLVVTKEKEGHRDAREDERISVGGLPARCVTIRGASRSAYVAQGAGRYFVLNYTAPTDLYDLYLPAFERLLRSFHVLADAGAP